MSENDQQEMTSTTLIAFFRDCVYSGTSKRELRRREPKDKSPFWRSRRPPASGKAIRKGGGAKPPTFPDGFPGGRRPFRTPKSATWGSYLSAPFGAAPVYGYPICDDDRGDDDDDNVDDYDDCPSFAIAAA